MEAAETAAALVQATEAAVEVAAVAADGATRGRIKRLRAGDEGGSDRHGDLDGRHPHGLGDNDTPWGRIWGSPLSRVLWVGGNSTEELQMDRRWMGGEMG